MQLQFNQLLTELATTAVALLRTEPDSLKAIKQKEWLGGAVGLLCLHFHVDLCHFIDLAMSLSALYTKFRRIRVLAPSSIS